MQEQLKLNISIMRHTYVQFLITFDMAQVSREHSKGGAWECGQNIIWSRELQTMLFFNHQYIKNKINYNIIYISNSSTSRLSPHNSMVPSEFATLLEMTLYKLVGNNLIPKSFVSNDFWRKLRTKFTNAGQYAKLTKTNRPRRTKTAIPKPPQASALQTDDNNNNLSLIHI